MLTSCTFIFDSASVYVWCKHPLISARSEIRCEIDAAADEAERALERRQEEWDMEQADLSYWEPDPNDYQSHVNALSELADQWEVMENDTELEDAVGS